MSVYLMCKNIRALEAPNKGFARIDVMEQSPFSGTPSFSKGGLKAFPQEVAYGMTPPAINPSSLLENRSRLY